MCARLLLAQGYSWPVLKKIAIFRLQKILINLNIFMIYSSYANMAADLPVQGAPNTICFALNICSQKQILSITCRLKSYDM